MTSSLPSHAPRWPVIIFLLWGLMGIAAFIAQYTADLTELAKSDPYQAQIWSNMPLWAWLAYAVAVACGLGAAICLLLHRKLAVILALVSLVAVLVQFAYTFFLTDVLAVKGPGAAAFPLLIIALAIAQLWFARRWSRRGILK